MNSLSKWIFATSKAPTSRSLYSWSKRYYHLHPRKFGTVHDNPGVTAKRIINCIGERLRQIDPARWDAIPITFTTHFRDANGFADVATSIHIHDALEKEFIIDVKDRHILITDVETAFYVVMRTHEAI